MTSGQMHLHANGTSNLEIGHGNHQDDSRRGISRPRIHQDIPIACENHELLAKGSKKKTTVVIVIVGLLLIALAAVVIVLKRGETMSMTKAFAFSTSKPGIPLESIIEGELTPQRFNGTWVSDSEILFRARDGSIMLYNARRRVSQMLLRGDFPLLETVIQYELSADRRYLMLAHSYQKRYRYTFLAYYHVVDLEAKKDWPITGANGAKILLQLVKWAPVRNAFVYVYLNDIYYRPSVREPVQEYRLTHTGRPGSIYNGVPDWVYEEEILSSNKAIWFSDNGEYLAFATYNDSRTPVMNIPYYGIPGDKRFQYTESINIRYPKPGRENPTVYLSVVNVGNLPHQNPIQLIDLPPRSEIKEPVLYHVSWASSDQLLVVWMNRVQNKADVSLCSTSATCRLILSPQEKEGWITFESPLFSKDGTRMIMIYPHDQGGKAGAFQHVSYIDLTASTPRPIAMTKGEFVVTELLAWDEENHFIYFLSTMENFPGQQKLYRIPDTTLGAPHTPDQVLGSNEVNSSKKCLFSSAAFSKDNSYFVHTCSGPDIPEVALYNKKAEKVTTWESNDRLRQKLANRALPRIEQFTVPLTDDLKAYVKLYIPPDVDTSGSSKYPLLVNVYGGPDSYQFTDKFSLGWHSYLTVNQSVIYATIDGRGSGLKGHKTLFSNYRHLGTREIADQINVTKWIQNNKSFIDKDRTAIWGWSYGGYATGMVLARDSEGVFKCGVSVAPVSDWLLYDTLYTERFMGLPTMEDNLHGYEAASLLNKVSNFRNKQFLLIHGTLDDNVHYQQSMLLAKALEVRDILFDQQSYPDEGHGLVDVQPHLYHKIEHFLRRCFTEKQHYQ